MANNIKTILFIVFLFFLFINQTNEIHSFSDILHKDDSLTVSDSDSEVLKLFKIRALGILPQIHNKFSSIENLEKKFLSNSNNHNRGKLADSKKNSH